MALITYVVRYNRGNCKHKVLDHVEARLFMNLVCSEDQTHYQKEISKQCFVAVL